MFEHPQVYSGLGIDSFFSVVQVMLQRLLFCYNGVICYNGMIGTTLAPTSCTNTMSRGLHLITQTIQLTDDFVDQVLIPIAALEKITVNDHQVHEHAKK